MLSAPDRELAERDRELPALSELLDPERLTRLFRRNYPARRITAARVTYTRYKPGRSCILGVELSTDLGTLRGYAKAHRRDAHNKLYKIRNTEKYDTVVLDDIATALFLLPNDRNVRGLRLLSHPESRGAWLRLMFPDRTDLWSGTVQAICYKPERRYVGRLVVDGQPRALLKFYTPHDYEASLAASKAFKSRHPLRVARRIGKLRKYRVTAQEWIHGMPLAKGMRQPDFDPLLLKDVGRALSRLHAQSPAVLTRRTLVHEEAVLAAAVAGIAAVCPHLEKLARGLCVDILRAIASMANEPVALHGDFYAKQVLLGCDHVAVIDTDRAQFGDPASDLGQFAAHLERDAIRDHMTDDEIIEAVDTLKFGYSREAARTPSNRELALYTALHLVRLTPEAFRHRDTDWPTVMQHMLERADASLRHARGATAYAHRTRTSIHDPHGLRRDRAFTSADDLLDPPCVERHVRRALGLLPDITPVIDIEGIRVARHKPGRRCIIEYDIAMAGARQETWMGRVRAHGCDRTAYTTAQDLWSGGFSTDCEDGISVPEPIACVPALNMWLQRKVEGELATDLLPLMNSQMLARRVADAAFKIHSMPLRPARTHDMAIEFRILAERLMALQVEHPSWTRRIDRILAACVDIVEKASPPSCPIHRDFYGDQVLVNGDQLFLLDFDLFCLGDPGLDIGNFVGHVIEQSIRYFGDATALEDCALTLVQHYLDLAGEERLGSIQRYALLTMVRHISISYSMPERRPFTADIMLWCEEHLQGTYTKQLLPYA